MAILMGGTAAAAPPDTSDTFVEDVRIVVPGARWAGALHGPGAPGPHPAVVLVSGSEDGRNLPGMAAFLAARGVVALDLDRRGVGESTGDWKHRSVEQRAEDALIALQTLRRRDDVHPGLVGVIGYGQGGWVAQTAAARSPDIALVVLLAGPGQSVRDHILRLERTKRERGGMDPQQVDLEMRRVERSLRLLSAVAPACRFLRAHPLCPIIAFDPATVLPEVQVPVLALFGEVDPVVPPRPNIGLLRDGLLRGGNRRLTVHVFPGANHQFVPGEPGPRTEEPDPDDRLVDGFLDTIAGWVTATADSLRAARARQPAFTERPGRVGRPSHGVYPVPSLFYNPETRWGAGIALTHTIRWADEGAPRRPTTTDAAVVYTQNRQVVASLFSHHFTSGNRYILSIGGAHRHFPESFYGVGSNLPASQRETYTNQRTGGALAVRRRVGRGLFVGGSLQLARHRVLDVDDGGLIAGGSIPGSAGGTTIGVGLRASWDTRDHVFSPERGSWMGLRIDRFAPSLGSDFAFTEAGIDVRGYRRIASGHVLAAQVVTTISRGDVPYQMMPRMGGLSLMRGYDPARFRDRDLIAAQSEYRAAVWGPFGAVAFVSLGGVAPDVTRIPVENFRLSYGAGLRVAMGRADRLNFRADYGFAGSVRTLYFTVGEAF